MPGLPHASLLDELLKWPEWQQCAHGLIALFSDYLAVVDNILGEIADDWMSLRRKQLARRVLELWYVPSMERARWLGSPAQDHAPIQQREKPQAIGNSIIWQIAEPSASDQAEKLANLDKLAAPFMNAVARAQAHLNKDYPQWQFNVQRAFGSEGWVNVFHVALLHKDESRRGDSNKGGRVDVNGPGHDRVWRLTENYRTLTEDEHYARLIAKLSEISYLLERAERM